MDLDPEILTWQDLTRLSLELASKLPPDVIGVLGIARRGMVPATIIAERLHIALGEVEQFIASRGVWMLPGKRRPLYWPFEGSGIIVVVDDAATPDAPTMQRVLEKLRGVFPRRNFATAAVWATEYPAPPVQYYAEAFTMAELQEPELLNTFSARRFAVDLDGVLCVDPPQVEQDGAEAWWEEHFANVRPLILPRLVPVAAIVTARLERYRAITEAWLHKWGVRHRRLIMCPAATVAERNASPSKYGAWKGEVYQSLDADLFVESCPRQAEQIRRVAGKPVLCVGQPANVEDSGGGAHAHEVLPTAGQRLGGQEQPLIYLGQPLYSPHPHFLSDSAFLRKASRGEKCHVVGRTQIGSLLTYTFNQLWAEALSTPGVTHFAMLHPDVCPQEYWLDTLLEEQQRLDADVVSVVLALKDERALTSTAVDDPHYVWFPRRLSLAEIRRLPETFCTADLPSADITEPAGGQLLVNTGCWLCDLRKPWVRQRDAAGNLRVIFQNHDAVLSWADGSFAAATASEDWNFSRALNASGAKIYATRKIVARHFGEFGFPNDQLWGQQESDLEWRAVYARRQAAA